MSTRYQVGFYFKRVPGICAHYIRVAIQVIACSRAIPEVDVQASSIVIHDPLIMTTGILRHGDQGGSAQAGKTEVEAGIVQCWGSTQGRGKLDGLSSSIGQLRCMSAIVHYCRLDGCRPGSTFSIRPLTEVSTLKTIVEGGRGCRTDASSRQSNGLDCLSLAINIIGNRDSRVTCTAGSWRELYTDGAGSIDRQSSRTHRTIVRLRKIARVRSCYDDAANGKRSNTIISNRDDLCSTGSSIILVAKIHNSLANLFTLTRVYSGPT